MVTKQINFQTIFNFYIKFWMYWIGSWCNERVWSVELLSIDTNTLDFQPYIKTNKYDKVQFWYKQNIYYPAVPRLPPPLNGFASTLSWTPGPSPNGLESTLSAETGKQELAWEIEPFMWATSWENLFMPYANNKGAEQPAHSRSLISDFVVHCLDSISLVSIFAISWL